MEIKQIYVWSTASYVVLGAGLFLIFQITYSK